MYDSQYVSRRKKRKRARRLVAVAFLALVALMLSATALFSRSCEAGLTGLLEDESPEQEAQRQRDQQMAEAETYIRAVIPTTESAETPSVWRTKPKAVKGIYLSAFSVASPNFQEYIDLVDKTELNAVVIDVKDVTGEVMYPSKVPLANEVGAVRDTLPELPTLIRDLKERDIYVIARVVAFEDNILPRKRPDLAVSNSATGAPWENFGGHTWANAYNRDVWEYNVAIAGEAAMAGFDEIQFDYVRFPSDGPMDQIEYGQKTYATQEDAIAGFLEYAHGELEPLGVYVAADVFGLVGHNDYVGIGQVVSKLAPHLDVICPMVYPSHYYEGSYGYPNPNAEPYGVVKNSMREFQAKAQVNKELEIRPWLQDFDLGSPDYGANEIRAQMQAAYDPNLTGWLLWNPANEYTEDALEAAQTGT